MVLCLPLEILHSDALVHLQPAADYRDVLGTLHTISHFCSGLLNTSGPICAVI